MGLDSRGSQKSPRPQGDGRRCRLVRLGGFAVGAAAFAGVAGLLGSAAALKPLPLTQLAAECAGQRPIATATTPDDHKHMLMQYCTACHNDRLKTAGMSVVPLDADNLQANEATWEKILRRVSLGEMPPKGMPRPPKEQIAEFTNWLAKSLDSQAAAHPDPGHATVRRMNRAEYANAVRDLLALDVDFSKELPVDDTGYGFDNIADVLTVSPTLMDRYINVAGKISRLATGQASRTPIATDYKMPKDLFEQRLRRCRPITSAPATICRWIRAAAVRSSSTRPMTRPTRSRSTSTPAPPTEIEIDADNRYEVKVPLKAGLRTIGASFPKNAGAGRDCSFPRPCQGPREPAADAGADPAGRSVDGARVKRLTVPSVATGPNVSQAFYLRDVMQISVVGPYDIKGPGDTPSRRKIFICRPSAALSESACAHKILATLARHAYRRPVTEADIAPLMKIYDEGRKGADFDHGIEAALEAVLVSPDFLFMRESDPAKAARRAPCTASAIWNWPRACPSSCGAAFPTTSCWRWRSGTSFTIPRC